MYTEVSSFQGVGIEGFHCVYRGVLISGCWNRGVPLCTEKVCVYTKVSSLE